MRAMRAIVFQSLARDDNNRFTALLPIFYRFLIEFEIDCPHCPHCPET
jgi:hypothetical protein